MVDTNTAQSFAERFIPVASNNPYWMLPSFGRPRIPDLIDPEHDQIVGQNSEASQSGFQVAVKNALKALNPFGSGPIANRASAQAQKIGEQGKGLISSAANAIGAVGAGISAGFKWGIILIMLGLLFYLYLVLAPLIPRRS